MLYESARASRPPWRVCPAGQCSNQHQTAISEAHPPATCCSREWSCFPVLQPQALKCGDPGHPWQSQSLVQSHRVLVGEKRSVLPWVPEPQESLWPLKRGEWEICRETQGCLEKGSGTRVFPPATPPCSPRAWSGLLPHQPSLWPSGSGSLGGARLKETWGRWSRGGGWAQPSPMVSSPTPLTPPPALLPAGRRTEKR